MNTSCKSRDRITVGLIDSLISISRVLAKRLHKSERYTSGERWIPKVVQEALKDLHQDEDMKYIMTTPFNKDYLSEWDRRAVDLITQSTKYLRDNKILIDIMDVK